MPNKLKFYISNNNKVYTLKAKSPENKKTEDAHYKFLKAPTFTNKN